MFPTPQKAQALGVLVRPKPGFHLVADILRGPGLCWLVSEQ